MRGFVTTLDVPKLVWTIGDVIRKERDARGWTQQQLATKADVDRTAVGRLEKGGNFEQQTLVKVARAFRLAVSDLYAEVPPREWPIGDALEAWLLFKGIKEPADRAQALERLERFSSVKRARKSAATEAG